MQEWLIRPRHYLELRSSTTDEGSTRWEIRSRLPAGALLSGFGAHLRRPDHRVKDVGARHGGCVTHLSVVLQNLSQAKASLLDERRPWRFTR